MKRFTFGLLAVAVALAMAIPALADSSLYGSVRFTTFYDTVNFADSVTDINGDDSDSDLTWNLQSNSRIGGKFTTGDLGGRFEYGTGVNLRLLYGTWDFGSGTLLIGQDYTPYTYFSDQVVGDDQGSIGFGAAYDGRQPQIRVNLKNGFYLAAIKPAVAALATNDATDSFIPKLAVGYDGKVDGFSYGVGVAYQTFDDQNDVTGFDESVNSYLIYTHGKAVFGYEKSMDLTYNLYYGSNTGNFGILRSSLPGTTSGGVAGNFKGTSNKAVAAGANMEDTSSYGGFVQFGLAYADNQKMHIGVGYISDDNDLYDDASTQMSAFINTEIHLAKTFFVVPEVSYFDFGDSTANSNISLGDALYVGAKWQMNF